MPQRPAARPPATDPVHGPVPVAPRPGGPGPRRPVPPPASAGRSDAVSEVVTVPAPARDLTVNKVLAGAGAAATSAVLGSFFGAAGTVAGAALGSVASTVAATFYQRYLDRTRDTIVARIRPVAGGSSPSELTLPMQRSGEDTVRLRVEPAVPPAPPRRRWWVWAVATVLVFAIGLLAVTGIEWAKGSTLTSNDSGTSVGRVLGGERSAPVEPDTTPVDPTGGSTDATATPDPSSEPSSTAVPGQDGSGIAPFSGTPDSGAPSTDSGAPTTAPGLGGLLGGPQG